MEDSVETNKVYGDDISRLSYVYSPPPSYENILDPRCNTVSFVKRDGLLEDSRNVVAISEKYICYAVRGTLLRVIQTLSGEKILLRGHESHVLDLKYSTVDRSLLCSVDGGSGSGSHVFVWQMLDGKELNHLTVCQFPFQASTVQPHPRMAQVWGLSFQNRIGIFSTLMASTLPSSYNDLALNSNMEGNVIDFSFSHDGSSLAVAVGPHSFSALHSVIVYTLACTHDAILHGSLNQTRVLRFDSLSCAQFVNPHGQMALLTAAQVMPTASGGTSGGVSLDLVLWRWPQDSDGTEAEVWQRIEVTLPLHENSGLTESSQLSSLIVSVPLGKYVVVSNRRSHVVCCLAIAPTDLHRRSVAPFYHATYLNLKWPVWSAVATSISGRDHHSDEEVEHLEVNCLQEQDSTQAAVQQYHVPWSLVFGMVEDAVDCPQDTLTLQASEELIQSSSEVVVLDQATSTNSYKGDANSFLVAPVSSLLGVDGAAHASAALTRLLRGESLESTPPIGVHAVEAEAYVEPQDKRIISFSVSADSDVNDLLDLPSPQQTPSKVVLPMLMSTPAATAQLLSFLRNGASHDVPSTSSNALPSVVSRCEAVEIQNMSVFEPVSMHEDSLAQRSAADDGWDEAMMRSSDIVTDIQIETSSEDVGAYIGRVESSSETGLHSALSQLTTALLNIENSMMGEQHLQSLKTEVFAALQAMEKRQGSQHRDGWDRVMKSHDKDKLALQTAVLEALHGKWQDQLSSSMSHSLALTLAPGLSEAIKTEIQNTVSNALKQSLSKAFRKSFESSLLPAFQAGTDRMFAQISLSFDEGLDKLVQQGEASQRALELPLQELRSLREEVKLLRSELAELALEQKKERDLGHYAAAAAAAPTFEAYEGDPEVLLDEGRVGEAVELAVELKSSDALVRLLQRLTPADVVDSCHSLCILCVAQQLASDFAGTREGLEPAEGLAKRMEWLKELLMACDADESDASLHQPRACIISSVLESLKDIEVWLTREGKLQGTVKTDLKMLKAYISNFI